MRATEKGKCARVRMGGLSSVAWKNARGEKRWMKRKDG